MDRRVLDAGTDARRSRRTEEGEEWEGDEGEEVGLLGEEAVDRVLAGVLGDEELAALVLAESLDPRGEDALLGEDAAALGPSLDAGIHLDLLFDLVCPRAGDARLDAPSAALFQRMAASLPLSVPAAQRVVRNVPWVLSYRPRRNSGLLAALAVSLALTPPELQRCVCMYPRMLCLSVDGKVAAVLRLLAVGAAQWLDRGGVSPRLEEAAPTLAPEEREAYLHRRGDAVRTLVRGVLLQYPLVLGCAVARVSAGVQQVLDEGLPFAHVVRRIRRSKAKP